MRLCVRVCVRVRLRMHASAYKCACDMPACIPVHFQEQTLRALERVEASAYFRSDGRDCKGCSPASCPSARMCTRLRKPTILLLLLSLPLLLPLLISRVNGFPALSSVFPWFDYPFHCLPIISSYDSSDCKPEMETFLASTFQRYITLCLK